MNIITHKLFTPKTKEKLYNKINKTDTCWEWLGSKDGMGYGELCISSINYKAHRLMYFLDKGEISIDRKYCIDHICNNEGCVNPDHLRQITQWENTNRYHKGVMEPKTRGCQEGRHFKCKRIYRDCSCECH